MDHYHVYIDASGRGDLYDLMRVYDSKQSAHSYARRERARAERDGRVIFTHVTHCVRGALCGTLSISPMQTQASATLNAGP